MRNDIFKAYDIRGKYPADVNEEAAGAIGFGLARYLDEHEHGPVVVGYDSRLGSTSLAERAIVGLQQGGRDVVEIGLVTSPMFYFSVNRLAAAGGLMVTASHNPASYNGFKLVREEAIPMAMGTGLEIIQREAEAAPAIENGTSRARQAPMAKAYAQYFLDRFVGPFTRRMVVDAGNGVAGTILPDVLDPLGIPYTGLLFEPDGRFPNHEANPLVDENLTSLRHEMRASPGAIGVAFDGDGDRVAFLDEEGVRIRGDLITALIAEALLAREGSGIVLYDLRSSHAVPEAIATHGGEPVRIRVGHAFIKQAMREKRALCGGELSYHYYFRDFFYCESGILAMLLVLEILEERNLTLKAAIAPLRTYAHSDEVNFQVTDPKSTIERIATIFDDATQDRLDGLTVTYPDWWFNLR
ncbi:MAG: phosphomannomutase/phosphoglucomutase, partial [Candidatus Atribacteria bacterium]